MKYEISLTELDGDIVPLLMVGHSRALRQATAGGTPFHEPAYRGSLPGFIEDLIREARAGRLRVCNQSGTPSTVDELIADARRNGSLMEQGRRVMPVAQMRQKLERERREIAPGVWSATHVDLGPWEVDWLATYISALFTTRKWLNEWAADRGDEYVISHGVAWIDERGEVHPSALAADGTKVPMPDATPNSISAAPEEHTGSTGEVSETPEMSLPDGDGEKDEPRPQPGPLPTADIAFAFAGLHQWDEAGWLRNLGKVPRWLERCRVTRGKQGGASARWNPVLIGAALVSRHGAAQNQVRGRFQSKPMLKPWLEAWKTYEADYLDNA